MKPEIILKLLKLTKSTKKSAGFTLIELLVAAIITSIIVSIAGWGLVTLMSSKKVADTQTAMQGETNRAADFINDEIRKAKFINKADTIALLDDADPDFARPGAGTTGNDFDPTSKSIVLALQISDAGDTNADDEMVIYYVKNNDNNWRGPKVIYRWGPAFDTNGNYSVTTNNLAYTDEPLIDSISNTVGTCTSGTLKGDTGFYTCLGGQQGTGAGAYYTSAQIYVNGLFKKPGDINAVAHYTGSSKTDTKAVSRINQSPQDSIPSGAGPSTSPSQNFGSNYFCKEGASNWNVTTKITIDDQDKNFEEGTPIPSMTALLTQEPFKSNGKYKIGKEGTDIDGNGTVDTYEQADGNSTIEPIAIKTKERDPDNPGSLRNLATPEKFKVQVSVTPILPTGVTSCDNAANVISSNTHDRSSANNKVMIINNTDSFTYTTGNNSSNTFQGVNTKNLADGFDSSSSTADLLNDYLSSNSTETTNIVDGSTITTNTYTADKLNKNEVVFLFEIGQDTSNNNSGFDLQDKMIKLTW